MRGRSAKACVILCTCALLGIVGCAGILHGKFGSIVPREDAERLFETFQIDPHLNYYYSGSDVYPNALIGLNKSYILESDLWKKVDMTPDLLKEFVKNMQTKALTLGQSQHGFAILDEKGNQIGIWYSLLNARTVVQMKERNRVVIYTPDIDTYFKHERDFEPPHKE